MTTLSALATAGLIARLCLAAPPETRAGDVVIEGDVTYQPGTGRLLVEGGAVLRRGAVVVRAPSASYDPASGEVQATGGVLLTDATRVVAADAIRAVLGGDWEAEGVVAFVKDAPADLSAATTLDEARRAGPNRLSFSGSRLAGDAAGRFTLQQARLTLCDCPAGGAPSWEVTSRKADVVPGKRATLSWPVLRITPRFLLVDRPIPVLVLPWLYVPLGDRQTGLLLPEVRSVASTGFALAQPLFVTLGRSADATLTAEYAFGRDRSDVGEGKAAVRGPGARLELRWAPAADVEGQVEVAWLHDQDREPGGAAGDRLAIEGRHSQRLSDRTSLRGALRLTSDPVWVRDLAPDVLARAASYRRSDLLLSRRGDALVLEAGASYLEPLRPNGTVDGESYGTLGAALDAASRWPAASATLLPVAAGPLRLSGRAGAARYAPVSGAFDREGRPAVARADARAEVSAPLLLGRVLSLVPYLRGAAAGYAFDGSALGSDPAPSPDPAASAWGVAGASLGTQVSRRFGAVRHVVAPRLEWRAGTSAAGDRLGWLAYDALDRSGAGLLSSGPPGAWQQLRAAVETRLARAEADLLRLELGQDLDLRSGRLAETFATAALSAGRLSADATARFLAFDGRADAAPAPAVRSAFLDRFTELRAGVSLSDGRGDVLHAGLLAVGAGGSGALVAGLDPLFDLRAAPLDAAAVATAGARFVAGGATLAYDALLPGRAALVPTCTGGVGSVRRVEGWQVQQHTGSVTWDSPCRCFRMAALVRVTDCGDVAYSASIDLSRLAQRRPR